MIAPGPVCRRLVLQNESNGLARLKRYDLTHEAAGEALGVHKSTSSRYADGSVIPLMVELAIEAWQARWKRGRKS